MGIAEAVRIIEMLERIAIAMESAVALFERIEEAGDEKDEEDCAAAYTPPGEPYTPRLTPDTISVGPNNG